MDFLNKIGHKLYPELIQSIPGSFTLLYLATKYKVFSLAFVLSFSVFERVLVFTLLSVIFGKFAYACGKILLLVLNLALFQKEKLKFIKTSFPALVENLSHGLRSVKDNASISQSDLLSFRESNPGLKILLEENESDCLFWQTSLGVSFLLIIINNKTLPYYILFTFILVVTFYYYSKYSLYKHECAIGVKRNREQG